MRDRRISRPADEFDHGGASLTDAWAEQASAWARWARTPGHDYYYEQYNAPAFLDFVPAPAGLMLDVGCGEGWLACEADQTTPVARADAAAVPIRDGVADLVVGFMVLQDVDDLDGAAHELARVFAPAGVVCAAIVHPIASSGFFAPDDPNHTHFTGRYASVIRHEIAVERDGVTRSHPQRRYRADRDMTRAAAKRRRTARERPDSSCAFQPRSGRAEMEGAPPLIANRFVPNFLYFWMRRAR